MARRPTKKKKGLEEEVAPTPVGGKRRRPVGTDNFAERVREQAMLTPAGFKKRTGIDINQALLDLGPTIRNVSIDDTNAELLVAWGRCAEKRLGMALFIEDVIRAQPPAEVVEWRRIICQVALGVWYNAEDKV